MKLPRSFLISFAVIAAASGPANAQQSESDYAVWSALTLTPIGALPPMLLAPGLRSGDRVPAFAARLGRWKFAYVDDVNFTAGASMAVPVGAKATVGGTIAYFKPGGSWERNGTLMFGGDLQLPVWVSVATVDNPSTLTISGKGSIGYGRFLGTVPANLYSLVGSVPAELRYLLPNKSSLWLVVSPGMAFGAVTGGGDPNQSGTLSIIGGSFGWVSATGIGVHAGMSKVVVRGGPPTVFGLAFSWSR